MREQNNSNENENALVTIKTTIRAFPKYPFKKRGLALAEIAKAGHLIHIASADGNKSFAQDNYGHLPEFLFLIQYSPTISLIIQKFEDGAKNSKDGFPYKSLGGAIWEGGAWKTLNEKEIEEKMRVAHHNHYLCHQTQKEMPTERSVIFSTIPDMFPELEL